MTSNIRNITNLDPDDDASGANNAVNNASGLWGPTHTIDLTLDNKTVNSNNKHKSNSDSRGTSRSSNSSGNWGDSASSNTIRTNGRSSRLVAKNGFKIHEPNSQRQRTISDEFAKWRGAFVSDLAGQKSSGALETSKSINTSKSKSKSRGKRKYSDEELEEMEQSRLHKQAVRFSVTCSRESLKPFAKTGRQLRDTEIEASMDILLRDHSLFASYPTPLPAMQLLETSMSDGFGGLMLPTRDDAHVPYVATIINATGADLSNLHYQVLLMDIASMRAMLIDPYGGESCDLATLGSIRELLTNNGYDVQGLCADLQGINDFRSCGVYCLAIVQYFIQQNGQLDQITAANLKRSISLKVVRQTFSSMLYHQ